MHINESITPVLVKYHDVNFKFVSNHYDIHLNGSCYYNKKLCEFKTEFPEWNEAIDDYDTPFVKIYHLTLTGKLHWLWRQWLFEQCVSYNWSYRDGKMGKFGLLYYIKPQWFKKWLLKWYYNRKKYKQTKK